MPDATAPTPAPPPLTIPVLPTESGRFTLRPFTPDDAPDVHEYLADPRIAETTTIHYPYPEGAAESWIATHGPNAQAGTELVWAIATPEDDRAIGTISLRLTPRHSRAELGYWLAVLWWGQGVMSDAARTVVAYGFDTLGLHRIQARCLAYNIGSSRVMEKAGMTFEGVSRDFEFHKGAFADMAMYAIIAGREGETGTHQRP